MVGQEVQVFCVNERGQGRIGWFSLLFRLMQILHIFLTALNINDISMKGCKEMIKYWSI